jgi:hypothetical protein
MLLASLVIVAAGIVRVTSRIVRGWVRRNVRAIIGSVHHLEKSTSNYVIASIHHLTVDVSILGDRFYSAEKTILVTLGIRYCCRVGSWQKGQ